MSDHVSIERMSEALDGSPSAEERAALDEHIAECAPCRREYLRLSEIVESVRALPRGAAVPTGGWEAVSRRIAGTERASSAPVDVLSLPTARERGAGGPRRRVSASVPQLAAATIVVAVLSSAVTWVALRSPLIGSGAGDASTLLGAPVEAGPPPGRAASDGSAEGAAARAVSLEDGRYAEAVTRLEQILDAGRHVLAPETLVTIEASLRTVDTAIAEVEAALAEDPGSDLLLRLLASHRSTKLGVLQRAAAAVEGRT